MLCYKCDECGKEIIGNRFIIDGKDYCEDCYKRTLSKHTVDDCFNVILEYLDSDEGKEFRVGQYLDCLKHFIQSKYGKDMFYLNNYELYNYIVEFNEGEK